MRPFLKGSEKLIIRKVPMHDLKLGDLILYKDDNQLICHRLVKRTKNNGSYHIYSRGDASSGQAKLVDEQMFQGKVIGIMRGNKVTSLQGFRQNVINRINLILLPAFNLVARLIRRLLF